MQRVLLVCHRWVALIASILVVVVALSGSIIVFEGAIDRALNPQLWHVEPGGALVSLDTMAAHARVAAPGVQVGGISLAPVAGRAFVVQIGALQVFVNPYTGAVLGTRSIAEWNRSFPRRMHVLHVTLMGGKIGGQIVAAITVAAFLLVLSGMILWWPDRILRVRWNASWKRIVFDLHHVSGILAALVILMISASGMAMHYDAIGNLVARLDRVPPEERPDQPPAPPGTPVLSLDSAVQVARATLPDAHVMFVQAPMRGDSPDVVAMRFPEDHTPGGRSRVFIDRYSGEVLLVESTRGAQLGTRLGNVMRSVHTGDVMGRPTEVIWLLAALALAGQSVTGVIMWLNARKARTAAVVAKK
jgi:uncharacterized iron-regulated membrane protein